MPPCFNKYVSKSSKSTVPKEILSTQQKESIRQVAYISQRGYTILKTALTESELANLRVDLFKIPIINGQPSKDNGFPIWRENNNKIYLPRFYGIERYGQPSTVDLPEGDTITVKFQGSLLPHQVEAIEVYLKHVGDGQRGGGILELSCGMGKTVLALNLISRISRKTMILVHKEFLMEQWISRIGEFLPNARVGKLQGKHCEIEGNDIVIGMIQSIYNKDFPAGLFSGFGLTIIDEVHRIGSAEFSSTLTKMSSRCMLGISATVERKDQLTNVLYSFIGPKIHSVLRSTDEPVCVKAIEYEVPTDEEYSQVEYDYMGKAKYSTMISKLCNYVPRSEFILRVIMDHYFNNPTKQMIVLGHNRCLLVYLHEGLKRLGETSPAPTTGYYLGGMKQDKLDESEKKQVVLATYAMAAEALDIKTLSTLFMVSPKTDIVQSVGRILRQKHDQPLILDLVDTHACFRNAWMKRRAYYRKCNYHLQLTTYQKYPHGWKTLFSCRQETEEKDSMTTKDKSMFNVNDIILPYMEKK